jgi:hypothetical protein
MKTLSAFAFVAFTAAGALAQSAPGYQWIHVAADPSLAERIWFCKDGIPVGPASFQSAIGFIMGGIPATHVVSITTDQTCDRPLASEPITSTEDAFYQFLAVGVVNAAQFAPNPDGIPTGLRLIVNDRARLLAPPDSVNLTFVHAMTDAPPLAVRVRESGAVYTLGPFGTILPNIQLPGSSGLITLEVFALADADFENLLAIRQLDLTELRGQSLTLVATGFLNPDANHQGAGISIVAVPVDGVVENLHGPVVMVEIDFFVDMSEQIRYGHFDPVSQYVFVVGDFNGWDPTADTLAPAPSNPGIYWNTIRIDSVLTPAELNYKFVTGSAGSPPSGWEYIENRKIVVSGIEHDPDGDGYLDVLIPYVPYFDAAARNSFFGRDVDVTFTVDVRPAFYFLADSGWVPSDLVTHERIENFSAVFANGPLSQIPGGWAAWGPDSLGSQARFQLFDDGTRGDAVRGDSVYTWLHSYAAGDRRDGQIKFSLNGFENEAPPGISHRISIPDDAATAQVGLVFGAMEDGMGDFQDDVYDPYILVQRIGTAVFATPVREGGNIEEPFLAPVDVEIAFAVDMSLQIDRGYFDPDSQIVVVAGSYNQWDTTSDTLAPNLTKPQIYESTVRLRSIEPPVEIEYKYATGALSSEPPSGFESGSNRLLTITGDESDTDEDGYVEVAQPEIPYFDRRSPEDFFTRDVDVVFSVDLRPAFYMLADSGWVPSGLNNGQRVESFSGVWINGPLAKTPNGWENWGPDQLGLMTEFQLLDDGIEPDDVAGDTLYSWFQSYAVGERRTGRIRFGLDGYNNEAVQFVDHVLSLPDDSAEARVDLIFGAMEDAFGGYSDDLYDPYILLTWGGPDIIIPVVVRSGGDQGDTAVDVEELAVEVPTEITLGDNYPNPFNPTTTFEYTVNEPQHVRIDVYDMSGRRVATLVDQEQTAAAYRVTFDATALSSGVYIYQLVTGGTAISKKMLLLK